MKWLQTNVEFLGIFLMFAFYFLFPIPLYLLLRRLWGIRQIREPQLPLKTSHEIEDEEYEA